MLNSKKVTDVIAKNISDSVYYTQKADLINKSLDILETTSKIKEHISK